MSWTIQGAAGAFTVNAGSLTFGSTTTHTVDLSLPDGTSYRAQYVEREGTWTREYRNVLEGGGTEVLPADGPLLTGAGVELAASGTLVRLERGPLGEILAQTEHEVQLRVVCQ